MRFPYTVMATIETDLCATCANFVAESFNQLNLLMALNKSRNTHLLAAGFLASSFMVTFPAAASASQTPDRPVASVNQMTVSGTVTDESGEPVVGASVIAKGTTMGTATDIDGRFSLKCASNAVIVISYIGYKEVEYTASQIPSTIVLQEDTQVLDEVVVIGYGTTTRKAAVGAVDQVKGSKLANRPVSSMTQALQGAAPNVIIQSNSYDPNNQDTRFNIRGVTSTTNSDPLFVIDGVVADNGAFNRLNPNDVENISVLKDASAAAIYGSRSAAGVILVTTKTGRKDQTASVSFSANVGWEDPYYQYSAVDGYQNALLYNMALTNAGRDPKYSPADITDLYNHRSEERWALDDITRTALMQKYNVMVSGGTAKSTYMFSLGYFNQASNLVGRNNKGITRYNMRMNVGTDIGRLHLGAIMSFVRNDSQTSTANLGNCYANSKRTPKYYFNNLVDAEGRYVANSTVSDQHALAELNSDGYNKYKNNDWQGNLNAEFKIIEGLKLRGVLGVNVHNETRSTRSIPYGFYSAAGEWQEVSAKDYGASNWNADSYNINTQLLLDFNRTFGKHTVSALFGYTTESNTSQYNDIWKNYVDPDLGTSTDMTNSEVGYIGGGTFLDSNGRSSIQSIIGRVGYNWSERYFAEFTFRYDGSSKFHKDYRWGFFPSVSLAWRPTEEIFLETYRQNIGDLKIRASYGVLGQQAVGDHDRFTTYSLNSTGYVINNQVVNSAGFTLGKDDLTWEKTKTYNIGVDATFLHNALQFSFDAFYKRTTDILQTPLYPDLFGTAVARDNIGEMSNRGWEMSINYFLRTGEFNHSFSFNLGDTQNKLLKFVGHEAIDGVEEIWRIRREGLPYNSYFGYNCIGIFQNYEEIESSATPPGLTIQPGNLKYEDVNKDGIIDSNDRVVLGNAFPRYTFGFNYGLEWRGIDFSMFWQGVGKRSQHIRGENIEPFHADYSQTMYKHQLDFWTPTNTDAEYPRLAVNGSDSQINDWKYGSSKQILNGAYARLKNISVGYSLPENIIRRIGMTKCRIYFNGENLLTLSHNSWIDPETTDMGTNAGGGGANSYRSYPSLRYYGFGIDVNF